MSRRGIFNFFRRKPKEPSYGYLPSEEALYEGATAFELATKRKNNSKRDKLLGKKPEHGAPTPPTQKVYQKKDLHSVPYNKAIQKFIGHGAMMDESNVEFLQINDGSKNILFLVKKNGSPASVMASDLLRLTSGGRFFAKREILIQDEDGSVYPAIKFEEDIVKQPKAGEDTNHAAEKNNFIFGQYRRDGTLDRETFATVRDEVRENKQEMLDLAYMLGAQSEADQNPENFVATQDGRVGRIDVGCFANMHPEPFAHLEMAFDEKFQAKRDLYFDLSPELRSAIGSTYHGIKMEMQRFFAIEAEDDKAKKALEGLNEVFEYHHLADFFLNQVFGLGIGSQAFVDKIKRVAEERGVGLPEKAEEGEGQVKWSEEQINDFKEIYDEVVTGILDDNVSEASVSYRIAERDGLLSETIASRTPQQRNPLRYFGKIKNGNEIFSLDNDSLNPSQKKAEYLQQLKKIKKGFQPPNKYLPSHVSDFYFGDDLEKENLYQPIAGCHQSVYFLLNEIAGLGVKEIDVESAVRKISREQGFRLPDFDPLDNPRGQKWDAGSLEQYARIYNEAINAILLKAINGELEDGDFRDGSSKDKRPLALVIQGAMQDKFKRDLFVAYMHGVDEATKVYEGISAEQTDKFANLYQDGIDDGGKKRELGDLARKMVESAKYYAQRMGGIYSREGGASAQAPSLLQLYQQNKSKLTSFEISKKPKEEEGTKIKRAERLKFDRGDDVVIPAEILHRAASKRSEAQNYVWRDENGKEKTRKLDLTKTVEEGKLNPDVNSGLPLQLSKAVYKKYNDKEFLAKKASECSFQDFTPLEDEQPKDADFAVDVCFGNRLNFGGEAFDAIGKAEKSTQDSGDKNSLAFLHQQSDEKRAKFLDLTLGEHNLKNEIGEIAAGRPILLQGLVRQKRKADNSFEKEQKTFNELNMALPVIDGKNGHPDFANEDVARYVFATAKAGFEMCKEKAKVKREEEIGEELAMLRKDNGEMDLMMEVLLSQDLGIITYKSSTGDIATVDFKEKLEKSQKWILNEGNKHEYGFSAAKMRVLKNFVDYIEGENAELQKSKFKQGLEIFEEKYHNQQRIAQLESQKSAETKLIIRSGLDDYKKSDINPFVTLAMQFLAAQDVGVDLQLSNGVTQEERNIVELFKSRALPRIEKVVANALVKIDEMILNIYQICQEVERIFHATRSGDSALETVETIKKIAKDFEELKETTTKNLRTRSGKEKKIKKIEEAAKIEVDELAPRKRDKDKKRNLPQKIISKKYKEYRKKEGQLLRGLEEKGFGKSGIHSKKQAQEEMRQLLSDFAERKNSINFKEKEEIISLTTGGDNLFSVRLDITTKPTTPTDDGLPTPQERPSSRTSSPQSLNLVRTTREKNERHRDQLLSKLISEAETVIKKNENDDFLEITHLEEKTTALLHALAQYGVEHIFGLNYLDPTTLAEGGKKAGFSAWSQDPEFRAILARQILDQKVGEDVAHPEFAAEKNAEIDEIAKQIRANDPDLMDEFVGISAALQTASAEVGYDTAKGRGYEEENFKGARSWRLALDLLGDQYADKFKEADASVGLGG